MSGNAAEWAGACDGVGADATCNVSGGSYKSGANYLECWPAHAIPKRAFVTDDVGFRCCADGT